MITKTKTWHKKTLFYLPPKNRRMRGGVGVEMVTAYSISDRTRCPVHAATAKFHRKVKFKGTTSRTTIKLFAAVSFKVTFLTTRTLARLSKQQSNLSGKKK